MFALNAADRSGVDVALLHRLLGSALLDAKISADTKTMDYSGALVYATLLMWNANDGDYRTSVPEAIVKVVNTQSDALMAMASPKALRTAQSYGNEARVLLKLCPQLRENGISVPMVLAVETEGTIPDVDGPIDISSSPTSTSSLLNFQSIVVLERLAPPRFFQSAVLKPAASTAAINWLARFHAFGMTLSGADCEALGLWRHGGHTPLLNRPANELTRLAAEFEGFRMRFANAPAPFRQPAPDLGRRLQAIGKQVSEWLVTTGPQTLVHGDFKSGNIFVEERSDGTMDVSVIDWQWCGWGSPLQDVLYFLSTSADDECCDQVSVTLQRYHDAFLAALPISSRAPPSLPEMERLFRLATLDYARWALGYRLLSESPEAMLKRAAARPMDINQGEFRRSFKRLSWLLALVEKFLPFAESGELGVSI